MSAHRISPAFGVAFLLLPLLNACVEPAASDEASDAIDAPFGGKADGLGISSEAACAALRVANEATFEGLDVDAGLDARAARGIVERRPFADLDALDAVPYVGQTVLVRLVNHAADQGISCDTGPAPIVRGRVLDTRVVHDEWRPGQPLAYTFWAKGGRDLQVMANGPGTRNTPVVTVVGPLDPLDMRFVGVPTVVSAESEPTPVLFTVPESGIYALLLEESQDRAGFVDFRLMPPDWAHAATCDVAGHCDCDEDAECGTGAVCLPVGAANYEPPPGIPGGKCAPLFPGKYASDACDEPAGVYRTIPFTAEEACAALDVLNHAPWSDLRDKARGWHHSAYFGAPGEIGWERASRWTSLAQFARQTVEFGGVGSSTMRGIKSLAQSGADYDEPTSDTVESTFIERYDHSGKEVVLDGVLLGSVDPQDPSCGTIRDEAGASRYLRLCSLYTPLTELAGERISIFGTLSYRDRKWTIDAPRVAPAR